MVKNCDLVIENASRGCRSRAVFSSLRSQFFTIRTDSAVNWLASGLFTQLCH